MGPTPNFRLISSPSCGDAVLLPSRVTYASELCFLPAVTKYLKCSEESCFQHSCWCYKGKRLLTTTAIICGLGLRMTRNSWLRDAHDLPVANLKVLFESSPTLVKDYREEGSQILAEKIFQLSPKAALLNAASQGLYVSQSTAFCCSLAIRRNSSSATQARRCWWSCSTLRHWGWWSGLAAYYCYSLQFYYSSQFSVFSTASLAPYTCCKYRDWRHVHASYFFDDENLRRLLCMQCVLKLRFAEISRRWCWIQSLLASVVSATVLVLVCATLRQVRQLIDNGLTER